MSLENPQIIYDLLNNEISNVISRLGFNGDNNDVKNTTDDIQSALIMIQDKIFTESQQLQQHSEWTNFTIAFYGETNAGKSTIIEMLRIYFSEVTKYHNRLQFNNILSELETDLAGITALQDQVKIYSDTLEPMNSSIVTLKEQFMYNKKNILNSIEQLELLSANIRKNMFFLKKIIYKFKDLPEELELEKLKHSLAVLENSHYQDMATMTQSLEVVKETYAHLALIESKLSLLRNYADGVIIGDGRSDFTRENTEYQFSLDNNINFTLIDVPGIEGEEDIVRKPIIEAVQKAHAVFYIANKATPPQTGEGDKKGTLEKIAEHLGAQTEVWTIYNKRISSPRALKTELISEDENESLKVLDGKLLEVLGANYKSTIALSAYPAYLSLADYLFPDSKESKNRTKFLKAYTKEELLSLSGFDQLKNILSSQIVVDIKEKIQQSNYNKVSTLLVDVKDNIGEMLSVKVNPMLNKVESETQSVKQTIKEYRKTLELELHSAANDEITRFIDKMMRHMYTYIDKKNTNGTLKDKDLQEYFRAQIEYNSTNDLSIKLEEVFSRQSMSFQKKVTTAVTKMQEKIRQYKNLSDHHESISFDTFHININRDNGLDVKGLLASLAGGAALFWNPAGWIIMATGLGAVILGVFQAFGKLLSKSYRISQQKNAISSNLNDIRFNISERVKEEIFAILPKFDEQIDIINTDFMLNLQHIRNLQKTLKSTEATINQLSFNIKEGNIHV